jgi:glycosyltransferase involved in cell wall biosynthesis
MKIVHLIFSFHTGGSETMLVDVVNEQVKTHQVTLIIINSLVNKALTDKINNKVKVIFIGRKEKSRNPLPILKLNCLLMKESPAVIHCHNESIIKIIPWKKKSVFTAHSLRIPTDNFRYYKRVIAISESVKSDIEQRSNIKPILVYNGIKTDSVKQKSDYAFNTFDIVQVGRLDHKIKGQTVLLEALKVLVHEKGIKNINVDFIGEGGSLEYLQKLVRDYQLINHVHFLGIRDRDYIYEHLKDYSLFVQPSFYEGFGLTVVEAMAAKVPVLVSDIDGQAEIIDRGRYGYLFRCGDSKDCAKSILNIINTYGKKQIMEKINAAHIHACKYFNIDIMVQNLGKIYSDI